MKTEELNWIRIRVAWEEKKNHLKEKIYFFEVKILPLKYIK